VSAGDGDGDGDALPPFMFTFLMIVTGEFGHHEILHEVHRGVSVILTDHSNNERGFREEFRKNFTQLLAKYNENVEIIFSEIDRDPLEYI
jgi:putative NIF3 family GTP cyclohydrolase 1 type 2